jgi:hypothetical protein
VGQVDHDPFGRITGGGLLSAQPLGLGERGLGRRPADLALARSPVRERGQHLAFQRDDVPGVAHRLAGAARRPAVTCDDGPPGGGDVETVLTEPVPDPDLGPGQSWRDGVQIPVEGHQALRADRPLDLQLGGERANRDVQQRFVAASWPTVTLMPSSVRRRSSIRTASLSMPDWAWPTLSASGTVRHQRWAAEWLAFSTTPLRLPRRGGQMSTPTP